MANAEISLLLVTTNTLKMFNDFMISEARRVNRQLKNVKSYHDLPPYLDVFIPSIWIFTIIKNYDGTIHWGEYILWKGAQSPSDLSHWLNYFLFVSSEMQKIIKSLPLFPILVGCSLSVSTHHNFYKIHQIKIVWYWYSSENILTGSIK